MRKTRKIVEFPVNRSQRLEAAIALYYSGTDPVAALKEFLVLIDEGSFEAYYFAGCLYEEGEGDVEQDLDKALFYYQKSVEELGYLEGCLALGRLYYHGTGVAQDYSEAFYYYSMVDTYRDNAPAQVMLGRMYEDGQGIKQDLDKARAYYRKAEAHGNVWAIKNLALLEERLGHRFKGLWLRLRAGFLAFNIARKDPNDTRLRGR